MSELVDLGAGAQRPLWASTSAKNPDYSDVLYVEELASPDTVNTMPESTLDAFRDHGQVEDRLTGGAERARRTIGQLEQRGVDLLQITDELEVEGVEKFATSFDAAVAQVGAALKDPSAEDQPEERR